MIALKLARAFLLRRASSSTSSRFGSRVAEFAPVESAVSRRAALTGAGLSALPPLLYVYMPRPPLPGAHLLVYPVLAGVLFVLGSLFAVRRATADRRLLIITALCLLLSVAAGISGIVNSAHLRMTAPLDVARPAALLIFFVYGYYVAPQHGEREARMGLLGASLLILTGQAVIASLQLAGGTYFDLIYSEHKMSSFGDILRVTGSLSNPNSFAWIVSQTAIIVLLLGSGGLRFLAIILAAPLILFSGSRTMLLLFPVMVAAALVLRTPGRFKISGPTLGYSLVIALGFFLAVVQFREYFPYLGQLVTAAESGSLRPLHALTVRLEGWQDGFAAMQAEGFSGWFVGIGSRETTNWLDNDFIYVFVRFGALGWAMHLALILYLFWLFWNTRTSAVSRVGLQHLAFAVLMGAVRDTMGGWMYPLLVFYLAGLAAGISRRTVTLGADVPARIQGRLTWPRTPQPGGLLSTESGRS